MATVRASCPTCGDVELTTRDLGLQRCSDNGSSSYSFVCPACRVMVSKPAAEQVVSMLRGAGVAVHDWALPAELAEARHGPPVSHDDLLAFHLALADPGWLEAQVALIRRFDRPPSHP